MSDQGRLVAGRYRLVERIGRGGMGTVWRAEDELLGRQVAVKKLLVPPHLHDDERATLYERTRREARSAARINHPNVVVVHDVTEDEGLPCIVMEYVPSRTLGDVLKKDGPVSPREAARIGRAMVAALRAAHAAGVLHRDVKPANVLLSEGGAKRPETYDDARGWTDDGGDGGWPGGRIVLTDFGIATASGTSTLTRPGELIGSMDYLAPERVQGGTPGPACDLWALGATLYQAVEGRAPFHRDTPIETAYAIAADPLEPPRHAGALAPIIESLLEKDPGRRMTADQVEPLLRASAETVLSRTPVRADRADPAGPRASAPATSASSPPTAVAPSRFPSPSQSPTPTPTPSPSPSPSPETGAITARGSAGGSGRPRRGRRALVLPAVAAAVAAAAVGGVLLASRGGHRGPAAHPPASATASTTPPQTSSPSAPPPPPPGYHRARDPLGFSLNVRDGWRRQEDAAGRQVDYIDPTGKVGLRISVLDFAGPSPIKHWRDLEPEVKAKSPGYTRLRMNPTRYQGHSAAIWEWTWQGRVRTYHAVNLGFGTVGGNEYALYLSAPDAQWRQWSRAFDQAVGSFRLTRRN